MDTSLRDEQVLAFVARFEADEGYLPTPEEVGVACGLRSRNSARPILARLHERGRIETDHARTRLGRAVGVFARDDALDPSQELAICEFARVEMRAELDALARALPWAPSVGVEELLHREALARLAMSRAVDHAGARLRGSGARLTPEAGRLLRWKHDRVAWRRARAASWPTYAAASLAVSVISHVYVDAVGWRRFPYLGPALLGMQELYRRRELVDPRAEVVAARLEGGDEVVVPIVEGSVADLVDAATGVGASTEPLRPAVAMVLAAARSDS